jgi:hypothetical protein
MISDCKMNLRPRIDFASTDLLEEKPSARTAYG